MQRASPLTYHDAIYTSDETGNLTRILRFCFCYYDTLSTLGILRKSSGVFLDTRVVGV